MSAAWILFWDKYPRRVAKFRAQRAFEKIPPLLLPQVLEGLEHWMRYWKAAGTEERYIPHPATWLNQNRFEDRPTIPPPTHCEVCGGKLGPAHAGANCYLYRGAT